MHGTGSRVKVLFAVVGDGIGRGDGTGGRVVAAAAASAAVTVISAGVSKTTTSWSAIGVNLTLVAGAAACTNDTGLPAQFSTLIVTMSRGNAAYISAGLLSAQVSTTCALYKSSIDLSYREVVSKN